MDVTELARAPPRGQQERARTRKWFNRRFYFLHSACIFALLILGILQNGNRKYIPVDPKELHRLLSRQSQNSINGAERYCIRAYVNVHSTTIEDELAAVCCKDYDGGSDFSPDKQYHSNICHPRLPILGIPLQRVPFAARMTRPIEAWIFPLLPILIRLIYQISFLAFSAISRKRDCRNGEKVLVQEDVSPAYCTQSIMTTLRRLLFYVLLLNFRGWCLYIGANALEDYVILPWLTGSTVVSTLRTNPMSDVEHEIYSRTEHSCWYRDVMKAHHKLATENNDGYSDCYGRSFDFSDHVVLFLAHYLPIFVMEMLIYQSFPFWKIIATDKVPTKRSWLGHFASNGAIWNVFHVFLFLYMHLIICHTLKQTATYFHTPAETLVGYCISMIVQVPIICFMCSESSRPVNKFIGLSCNEQEACLSEKGD